MKKGQIKIYKSPQNKIELKVRLEDETLWLDAHQMAQIFNVDRTVIVKHINNVYKTGELDSSVTCAKIAQVASDGKTRKMNIYNLDAIISVGYRVNSKKATQFRIWATQTLKNHIIQGYTVNRSKLLETSSKLNQLQETIQFLQKKSEKQKLQDQGREILDLLSEYSKTLSLLEKYDKRELKSGKGQKAKFKLTYSKTLTIIQEIKDHQKEKIFGRQSGNKLESIINNLYQTFGKNELYPSIESKAAHLLYLIIKDHPFVDGNKRIASFLFVYFLDKNNYLYRQTGEKKINDNALTTLALLVAESNPKEKEQIIPLISMIISNK
jgi:death-on-curing family protein